MISLCKFSGRLSYPLYITHIGFVYVLTNYSRTHHPSAGFRIGWIFVLLPTVTVVAWFALKFYDEPIRAWLTRGYGLKRAAA